MLLLVESGGLLSDYCCLWVFTLENGERIGFLRYTRSRKRYSYASRGAQVTDNSRIIVVAADGLTLCHKQKRTAISQPQGVGPIVFAIK